MFMSDMRQIVLEVPSTRDISLAELEYYPNIGERPSRHTEASPDLLAEIHSGGQSTTLRSDPDIEMQATVKRNRLTRALPRTEIREVEAARGSRDDFQVLREVVQKLQVDLNQVKGAILPPTAGRRFNRMTSASSIYSN